MIRRFTSLGLSILAWAVFLGLFVLIHRVGTYPAIDWRPDNATMFALWLVASLLFGFAFWLISIVSDSTKLRFQSYGVLILVQSLAMVLTLICYFVVRAVANMFTSDLTVTETWAHGTQILMSPFAGVALLYVGLTAAALNFIRQMSAMVGSRILVNLLLGKYRHPKVETRIFMFLDLENSTTLAERLGHREFCRLIQECFQDLAYVVIRRQVEIYQYVGDEAILTWNPITGLDDSNCLQVYFEFEEKLHERSAFYREHFDVLPHFKAGVNIGPVTVAEIGVAKRDISYLSDVLNTAARLESICRSYEAGLLISEELKDRLDLTAGLRFERVGNLELRGKKQEVGVYRVEKVVAADTSSVHDE